jgi:methylglutaconyl-CoA hydratase
VSDEASGYRFLNVQREGAVEHVVLNRPDVRNAFNEHVIAELTDWAARTRDAAERHQVRVAIIGGAGRMFCAGADVAWMSKTVQYTEEENLRDAMAMSAMFAALNELPLALIGRVHGAALGGGAGLAAVCDMVVASDDTIFGFTEVKLGILPAVISPFVLAKIGRSAARELFLTGARFSAARAKEIGLVHAVVAMSDLDAAVAAYARELMTAGPEAVAVAKSLVPRIWGCRVDEAMPLAARAIAARRVSSEGQEGLKAFLDKRTPRWSEPVPNPEGSRDRND